MNRFDLIDLVLVKLEEYSPFTDQYLIGATQSGLSPVKSYIDRVLDEAAHQVCMIAPSYLISQSVLEIPNPPIPPATVEKEYVHENDGMGVYVLPSDFLKFGYIKFDKWNREASVISNQHPNYILQKNKYTRAGKEKPVVAISRKSEKEVLEIYPFISTFSCEEFRYIKKQAAEYYSGIENFIIIMTAMKVLDIMERPDLSKVMMEEFTLLLKSQTN